MSNLLLVCVLAACEDPTPDPAIEITGYLDAARISWTAAGGEVFAAGRDGAAEPGATVSLANGGALGEAVVADGGTFVVSVAAAAGDALELVSGEDEVAHAVPTHEPFPDHDHVHLYADPHDAGAVVVEVGFVPARLDGRMWVTDPGSGQVVVLEPADDGHLHGGHAAGVAGDTLLLHWVPDAGVESIAVEAVVAADPP